MKALTITQPWATLVAEGRKHVETRSWPTRHRGTLGIHAGAGTGDFGVRELREICLSEPFATALGGRSYDDLPKGKLLAVVNLEACYSTADLRPFLVGQGLVDELEFGNYAPGRYGWHLKLVHKFDPPLPAKGALGLWEVPLEAAALREGVGDGR